MHAHEHRGLHAAQVSAFVHGSPFASLTQNRRGSRGSASLLGSVFNGIIGTVVSLSYIECFARGAPHPLDTEPMLYTRSPRHCARTRIMCWTRRPSRSG